MAQSGPSIMTVHRPGRGLISRRNWEHLSGGVFAPNPPSLWPDANTPDQVSATVAGQSRLGMKALWPRRYHVEKSRRVLNDDVSDSFLENENFGRGDIQGHQ
jgi:hypothetical protein